MALAAIQRIDFAWTNKSDFRVEFQCRDYETDDLIDFTGASIAIRVVDSQGCERLNATVGDGITITGTGIFQLLFDDSDMNDLCAGEYAIGGIYRLSGNTNQLFVGTLSITEGIAEL